MATKTWNGRTLFKKGETIYQVGDASGHVYLLTSGLVAFSIPSYSSSIEVGRSKAPQLIGFEGLSGEKFRTVTAKAVNDTEAEVYSLAQVGQLIERFPTILKLIVQGALKKQWSISAEVLKSKMESAPQFACPVGEIPKLFATIYHAAVSTGKKKDDRLTVVWSAYRKYCHWGLMESPLRVEQALQRLAKLGYTELEMVKSDTEPNAPDELGYVHFKDVDDLKNFYRFCHQHRDLPFDRVASLLESSKDPLEKKHLLILDEIRNWNAGVGLSGAA